MDIQIGSRALHRRVDPVFLCELQTASLQKEAKHKQSSNNNDNDDDDTKESIQDKNKSDIKEFEKTLFECNFATLENMIEEFEQALREVMYRNKYIPFIIIIIDLFEIYRHSKVGIEKLKDKRNNNG